MTWPLGNGSRSASWGAAGIIAIFMMGAALPSPLYVLFADEIGFGATEITLLYAAYVGPALFGLVVLGSISDGLGRRPVLITALVIALLSTVCFMAAEEIALLYVARALCGLGVGLAMGTATAMMADLRPGSGRGTTGAASVATMVGLAFGPLLGGVLSEPVSDPITVVFAVYLGCVLTSLVWVVWFAPETTTGHGRIGLQLRLARPPDPNVQFPAACLASFSGLALQGFLASLTGLFLLETLDEPSRVVSGLIISAVFVLAAVPPRFLPARSSRMALGATAALVLASVALIELATLTESLVLFGIAAVASGLASGTGFAAGLAVTNELAPENARSAAFSAFYVASYAGLVVPVVGIGIATLYVSLSAATTMFAGWLALTTLALAVMVLRAEPVGLSSSPTGG